MPVSRIDGFEVAWREAGTGPPVLLAHCSLGTAGLWRRVMEDLADRWRLIAFDLPGHGGSDRGDPAAMLQAQGARYALGLMAEIGAPAHLVGLSLGGAVMARAALAAPARARSLTLIEPALFHLLDRDRLAEMDGGDTTLEPVRDLVAAGREEEAARAFMAAWGQPGQFDRFAPEAKAAVARATAYVAEDFYEGMRRADGHLTPEALSRLDLPMMALEGALTKPSASAVIDEIARAAGPFRRETIRGAGHLSPMDRPEAVAAALRDFLGGLEA